MPKAKTTKTSSGFDPSEEAVLKYLRQQNRPYSATDIFNNLHGAVGKTALNKVMQSLVDREEVVAKAYGKQVVYVIRQDNLPSPSNEELEKFDQELGIAKENLNQQKETVRTLQSTLSALNNSLTSEEMADRISLLETENQKMESKLIELRTGGRKVDPAEKASVDASYEKYSKLLKARRKMCMEIVGVLSESMGKKPSMLMEELGLEPDPSR